ncbi:MULTISPECIES: AAA family ATPase [Bradyrhizobium]|uniref:AAA family ATPase n=1 Tax=Bradyrhizobium TaxID=374 RepID=UPI002305DFD8|nr:ATP-binding protein [Bradyrhizobium sp. CCBAU 21362]MDA9539510.1 hypothetical protein [Bradyrhizobium sp. CCBAU 21362]
MKALPNAGMKFADEDEFRDILKRLIVPGVPIEDVKSLQGREVKLREISRALNSKGMHVFIHGERGIGKTSLAVSAAKAFLKIDAYPPYVGCDEDATFDHLVRDVCRDFLGSSILRRQSDFQQSAGINLAFLKYEVKGSGGTWIIPEKVETINEAADMIGEAAQLSGYSEPLIVVDEFDRIKDDQVKRKFSDLIKRIHDKSVNVRFIFCGIGKTLDELTSGHLSSNRPLHPVEVDQISHDARWRIVTRAADALGFQVDGEHLIRVGHISDGFPYYIHLVAQNLFWIAFDKHPHDPVVTSEDFHAAVMGSMEQAESPLKTAYKLAIQKTKNSLDYEEVLWSAAAGTHMQRQSREMYDGSYVPMMEERLRKEMFDPKIKEKRIFLTYEKYRDRLYKLTDQRHGHILEKSRNSWYEFPEKVNRGYVRLVAERNGVQLGADHF